MNELLSVAIAVIAGLVMTRLIKPLHLPDVTAYLLTGVVLGPYLIGSFGIGGIGFCSAESISALRSVSETALGFIAFAIGNEFRLDELKKIGKSAAIIAVLQALAAAVVTDLALILVHLAIPEKFSFSAAITLGAIATATAPAATLMVVRQYKAKGELTELLLPIVALDDAMGLVVFAISFGVAKAFNSGTVDLFSVVVDPLVEIILSLVLGAALGAFLTFLEKKFLSNSNRLSLIIGFVLLTVAVSSIEFKIGQVTVAFSSLLVCMMLGTVFCNTDKLSFDLMERADKWTAPLFIFFFVISGAELELSVFGEFTTMLIGIIYVLSRAAGKYFGAYAGCKITNQNKKVTQNLGIALFPQAGVALGMCITASALEGDGETIRNIVLFAIFVYEIFGPMLTKGALKRAGDIVGKSDMVKNRRTDILSGKHKTWNEEEPQT